MIVECKITKELYYNSQSRYRILSCFPLNFYPDLVTNNYNNFTISGTQLNNYNINQVYELDITLSDNTKYPWSYVVTGIPGITSDEKEITVDTNKEYTILCRYMEPIQAERCHEAYPNFINLILNNKESEIDVKKIYNVGEKRLASYIKKIHEDCKSILFFQHTSKYTIDKDEDILKIANAFNTIDEFERTINNTPYYVFCRILLWEFSKADSIVLKLWPNEIDSKERCTYATLSILKDNEQYDGSTKMNANILGRFILELAPEVRPHIVDVVKNNPLFYYDDETKYVSLASTYNQECNIANHIKYRLNKNDNYIDFDIDQYKTFNNTELTDEQLQLINLASKKHILVLNGPAGSGKTTCTKSLIKFLEDNNLSYTLLAPTGMAAKRIHELTGRDAYTIHRYILQSHSDNTDYYIIDEFSMVGVELLSLLLDIIGKEPNLIFICDEAQLPSISCGNIIQNILNSQIVPTIYLTQIFRYGIGGIATIATDIRNGNFDNILNNYSDYQFYPLSDDDDKILEQITMYYLKALSEGYNKNDIMIICPTNVNTIGTYNINNIIKENVNPTANKGLTLTRKNIKINIDINDKIINTKNNYHSNLVEIDDFNDKVIYGETEVMNGDTGFVTDIYTTNNNRESHMILNINDQLVDFSLSELNNILLGYCITIHKSQGSQAKLVIAVIPNSAKKMLSRNLLYVAVTRAQEKLILISDKNIIKEILPIQENNDRETWLEDLLKTKGE